MRFAFIFILIVAIWSCTRPPVKEEPRPKPRHSTEVTDPELKVLIDEFMKLSAQNNIEFSKKVSIGFSNINHGDAIGVCAYSKDFREIDIDIEYWKRASWMSKASLVWHELAHCYCGRDHDHDDGVMYPDGSLKSILQDFFADEKAPRPDGNLPDGCPKSLMYPSTFGDRCFQTHYKHYTQEMFARCNPW